MEATEGCQWLVQWRYDGGGDPDWHPDFPEDCYRILPCGEPVDPGSHGPFCTFHREPMEMDLAEFERQVDNNERTWS